MSFHDLSRFSENEDTYTLSWIVFHMKCIQNHLKFILVLDPIFIVIFRVWLLSILILSENTLVTSVSVTYVNEDDW